MTANPAELVVMGANPKKVLLRDVKAAEAEYANSVSRWGSHDQGTIRLEMKWRDLQRAYEAQTGKKMYQFNPGSDVEAGARMYEEFHGEAPDGVEEIHEPSPRPATLSELGDLLELQVKRASGWKWAVLDFTGRGVKLASNVEGKQLYFVDGEQKISRGELTTLGADNEKELIDLGEAMLIAYRARKVHIHGIAANYEHHFGEETGVRPRLLYDRRGPAPRLHLAGGEYRVEAAGIIN
jgi:hypothetical protein